MAGPAGTEEVDGAVSEGHPVPYRRRRLGEILVDANVLTQEDLEEALAAQVMSGNGARLGTILIELGLASESDVAEALATRLSLQTVDLAVETPDPKAVALVPRQLAFRHLALPMRIDGTVLSVATSDPTNVLAKDDLRTAASVDQVRILVATETSVREALRHAYGADQSSLDALLDDDKGVEEIGGEEPEELDASVSAAEGQPIVRLANLILAEAVHGRASDVHVEPGRTNVRIRYRVDGMLREIMRVPRDAASSLVTRLKIMARMDIAERRRPQDGRAVVRVEGEEVDLRVSTLPTLYGEKVVLRLLRKGAERLALDDVGLADDHLAQMRWALERPQGLVLITGPTGSGKTSTLYAGLAEIADPVRNICTLEDPVEYQLEGINQTQMNAKIGVTFASGLRTLLRQDPDVILVGEIRDGETAKLAMEASETGHLVLSTLHTNDAPSTVIRLMNLGAESFQVASTLQLIVAQRLARNTCDRCLEPYEPDDRTLTLLGLSRADLGDGKPMRGAGCEICGRTGYRGRLGVFEVMPITATIRDLIIEGTTESALARLARSEGMRTLREDGIRKALAGRTTFEEVLRIAPSENVAQRVCPTCDLHVSAVVLVCPSCSTDLTHARFVEAERSEGPGRARRPEPEGSAVPAPAPTPPPPPKRTQPMIVLVQDEGQLRDEVAAKLSEKYEVAAAGTAAEALALARSERPDAIVLDIELSDPAGSEIASELRADKATSEIPILMISGSDDPSEEAGNLLGLRVRGMW